MNTLIIYHRVDYDGVFSACIVEKYLREIGENYSILGYTFGDDVPNINRLIMSGTTKIILVDITLPVIEMKSLNEYRKMGVLDVLWIDHHITSINNSIDNEYSIFQGIRNTEHAACEYCWKYFYPKISTPLIIELISDYDIWNKDRHDWNNLVSPIQLSLKTRYGMNQPLIYEYFTNHLINLGKEDIIEELAKDGKLIQLYTEKTWRTASKIYSFEITVNKIYKGVCILSTDFTSNIFQSIIKDYDICCIANRRDKNTFCCSMYMDKLNCPEFNLGEYLMINYGGGGHRCAAGCTLTPEQFNKLIIDCEI